MNVNMNVKWFSRCLLAVALLFTISFIFSLISPSLSREQCLLYALCGVVIKLKVDAEL